MTKAGEARRWTLHAANVFADVVTGDRLHLGERVRVREDKACEEDVEKVAMFLALELNGTLDEMWDGLPDKLKSHRREQATRLLAKVFGGPDDNE